MGTIVLVVIALGAVLLLGALGEVLFQRTGVPDLLFLMAAGLLLGPVLGLVQPADLEPVAPHVATVALTFAAFDTLGRLRLSGSSRPSGAAALLAAVGFAASVALVVPLAMIASATGLVDEPFGIGHAIVLAASLGGATAALSLPALGKARLDAAATTMLEGESAVGALLSLVCVAITVDVMTATGEGAVEVLLSLLSSTSVGVAVGMISGLAWLLFLRAVRSSEHAFALSFAAVLIVFATARMAHGDTLLAAVAFCLVAGNADALAQRLRSGPSAVQACDGAPVRSGLALLVRSALFVVAGMLMAPPWAALGVGALVVLLAAGGRVPAVLAATRVARGEPASRWVLAIALPRGLLALALALVPLSLKLPASGELASLAGSSVFLSVVAFVAAVLLLQRLKPQELTPGASAPEPSHSVSLIDSTARPAADWRPAIVAAGEDIGSDPESAGGPLSTRTPLPAVLPVPVPPPLLPVPPPVRPPAVEPRATMPSAPEPEELEVQEAAQTPRRGGQS